MNSQWRRNTTWPLENLKQFVEMKDYRENYFLEKLRIKRDDTLEKCVQNLKS